MDIHFNVNQGSSIHFQLGTKPGWYGIPSGDESQQQPVTVIGRGQTWFEGKWYQAKAFQQLVRERLNHLDGDRLFEASKDFVAGLNGFYSFIIVTPTRLLMVVDRGRSSPLFYSRTSNRLDISDDGFAIQAQLPSPEYDELAIAEFMILGFVTGCNTLNPHIFQVEPGSMLMIDLHELTNVKSFTYYVYEHDDANQYDEGALSREYQSMLARVTDRFIQSLGGKKLAFSLSGGYDSRLLAVLLKQADFKNAVFFTFGAPDNWEVHFGREIAKKLGYPWVHIPYTYQGWRTLSETTEYQDFILYSNRLSSYPFVQDFPAIQELLQNGIVQKGDIFMPGHSGDFISGSFLPTALRSVDTKNLEAVADVIYEYRYDSWFPNSRHAAIRQKMYTKLLTRLEMLPNNSQDKGSLFESWASHERIPKFIVNHMRNFEFHECEWRMLLWDQEIWQFWSRVPFEQRLKQSFYNKELYGMFTRHGIEGFVPRKLIPVSKARRYLNIAVDRIHSPLMGRFTIGEAVRAWDLYRRTFGLGMRKSMFRMYAEINTAFGNFILQLLSSQVPRGEK